MSLEQFIPKILQKGDFPSFYNLTENGFPQDRWPRWFLSLKYKRNPNNFAVVKNGRVIGGVIAEMSHPLDIGRVALLVVDSGYQGIGLGRMLFEHGIDRLHQQGARKVQLCTRTTNSPMIGLAQSIGFIGTGVVPDCYKDGAEGLNMELILNRDQS